MSLAQPNHHYRAKRVITQHSRAVMVEFTPHLLRDGTSVADWTPAEAVTG
jgi:hypothetical protein